MNPTTALPHKRPSFGWAVPALLVLLVVLAGLFHTPLLTALARALIVDSQSFAPADLIFVLNGDYNTRPFEAAELVRQGLAPMVLIARSEETPASELGLVPNETMVAVQVLESQGVPAERIVLLEVPGGVTSTYDEALALRSYLQVGGQQHVILVTSAFHSRRAAWIFERVLGGLGVQLQVDAVPYRQFDETDWWQSETGLITLNNEVLKLLFYYWTYR